MDTDDTFLDTDHHLGRRGAIRAAVSSPDTPTSIVASPEPYEAESTAAQSPDVRQLQAPHPVYEAHAMPTAKNGFNDQSSLTVPVYRRESPESITNRMKGSIQTLRRSAKVKEDAFPGASLTARRQVGRNLGLTLSAIVEEEDEEED